MKKYAIIIFLGFAGGLAGSFTHDIFKNKSAEDIASRETFPPVVSASYNHINTAEMAEMTEDFVEASAASTEGVVYIKTVSEQAGSSWFDWFFGGSGTQQVLSSGSGVIFTEDGYVVTNNHVIENAVETEVIFNKRTYKAKLIGRDPSSDLAVLKIEGGPFPALKTGTSRDVRVGEWVLAVGNPFNLESTVTAGIVSAKGRDLGIVKNQFPLESFIQTDAAINPGNSGGALVNLRGELIGINTAILSRTGSYSGYGFAVPVDVVKKIVNDLIQYGKVQMAFIGADVVDVDGKLADDLGAKQVTGVVVKSVREGGPAQKSGLKDGDIILGVEGHVVSSTATFDEEISLHSPGDKITLQVRRDNKPLDISLLLTNEEGTTEIVRSRALASASLGADFEPITKVEKDLYKIDFGVRASNIRGGMLSRIGMDDGFIITHINNTEIRTAEEAINQLQNARGRVVVQGISRNGSSGYYSYFY